jgi:hypothetical protein
MSESRLIELDDELIKPTDIETVALRVRKQRNTGLMPCLFWADLDMLLNLILGEKTND